MSKWAFEMLLMTVAVRLQCLDITSPLARQSGLCDKTPLARLVGVQLWNIASPMARQSGLCDIHLWVTNPNRNIIGTSSLFFHLKPTLGIKVK